MVLENRSHSHNEVTIDFILIGYMPMSKESDL
jgi:hypothetical protein